MQELPEVIRELGLKWKEPRRVETKFGPKDVINSEESPDQLFWKEWKEKKHELKDAGLSVSKDKRTGNWSICIWRDIPEEEKQAIEKAVNDSKAASRDIEIPVPEGLEYFPFQKAGIAYALERDNVIIGDDMGLGKTIQVLGIVNTDPTVKKVLVFCPNTPKLNWKREAEKWLIKDLRVEVIKNGKDFPEEFDILIINYDVANKHRKNLEKISWDLIVVDEFHKLKNFKAQRTQAIYGFEDYKKPEKNIPPLTTKRWAALSGTPIPNRIKELWPTLRIIDPEGLGKNFFAFHKKFCNAQRGSHGWDFDGASNLDILQRKLRERVMVRRLKTEVLRELPPKVRQVIEIPTNGDTGIVEEEWETFSKYESYLDETEAKMELALADENENEYRRQVDNLKEGIRASFDEMAEIRHKTAIAMIPHAIEHLTEALETGKSIVCFAHHKKVVKALKEAFPDSVVIDGTVPVEKRQQAIDDFQAGKVPLFIGSIKSCSEAITLTKSSHVVFVEGDWVPSSVIQAEDRCCRIGQIYSVLIQFLVLEGSMGASMAKRMLGKLRIIEAALDKGDVLACLREEPIVPTRKKRKKTIYSTDGEINLTEGQINAIHSGIQTLSAYCDGAREIDGMGFNKFDTTIGKSLAGRIALSKKQAKLAQGLVQKYQRQLPLELIRECGIIPKGDKKKVINS